MFVVSSITERVNRVGGRVYPAFLDIEKVYDRVNRGLLCTLLTRIVIRDRIVGIISSMYEDTRAMYSLCDLETDWVSSCRCVGQGCVQK